MSPLFGSVADDFTGASDLADTLVASGLRTILLIGLPEDGKLPAEAADADAVVFALKTRSIQASEAVRQSLAASRFLRSAGCRHLYFKYCSTFDSTDSGNIGPVADALRGCGPRDAFQRGDHFFHAHGDTGKTKRSDAAKLF